MDSDQRIRLKEQLIGQFVLKTDASIRILHQYAHKEGDYYACTWGTCGELNPLIKRAQQMGFTWDSVPKR